MWIVLFAFDLLDREESTLRITTWIGSFEFDLLDPEESKSMNQTLDRNVDRMNRLRLISWIGRNQSFGSQRGQRGSDRLNSTSWIERNRLGSQRGSDRLNSTSWIERNQRI